MVICVPLSVHPLNNTPLQKPLKSFEVNLIAVAKVVANQGYTLYFTGAHQILFSQHQKMR